MSTLPTFHSAEAAAALLTEHGLAVSVRWLQRGVQQSKIPHTRLAGKVRFSDAQLEQIVAMHTHTPASPAGLQPAAVRRRAS